MSERNRMTLRILLAAGAGLAALALLGAPANAGGGCHAGATQGSGEQVELLEACPTPTIVRIDPGGSVTFVNKDPYAHNVIGVGFRWGHPEELAQGDSFTATFEQAGIYPYACWIHPGMTGAVVVGDGTGAGNGTTVSVASATTPSSSPVAADEAVRPAPSDGATSAAGWIAGGALGLALGLVTGIAVRRRGREAAAPTP
jgi:plastocyanin